MVHVVYIARLLRKKRLCPPESQQGLFWSQNSEMQLGRLRGSLSIAREGEAQPGVSKGPQLLRLTAQNAAKGLLHSFRSPVSILGQRLNARGQLLGKFFGSWGLGETREEGSLALVNRPEEERRVRGQQGGWIDCGFFRVGCEGSEKAQKVGSPLLGLSSGVKVWNETFKRGCLSCPRSCAATVATRNRVDVLEQWIHQDILQPRVGSAGIAEEVRLVGALNDGDLLRVCLGVALGELEAKLGPY